MTESIVHPHTIAEALRNLNEEQWTELSDGHSLLKTKFYTDFGFPDQFVKRFIREFESDGSIKGTIFGYDGKVIEKAVGIYNLEFLRGLAHFLTTDYESCFGRGREARNIVQALKEKWL